MLNIYQKLQGSPKGAWELEDPHRGTSCCPRFLLWFPRVCLIASPRTSLVMPFLPGA